jgi:hypothetical protein
MPTKAVKGNGKSLEVHAGRGAHSKGKSGHPRNGYLHQAPSSHLKNN